MLYPDGDNAVIGPPSKPLRLKYYRVRELFLHGASNDDIRDAYPGIDEKQLDSLRTRHDWETKRKERKTKHAKERDLNTLCDENMSLEITRHCSRIFNLASHVYINEIQGFLDWKLWRYAKRKEIDLIITRDMACNDRHDLTFLACEDWQRTLLSKGKVGRTAGRQAKELSRKPMLLHVSADVFHSGRLPELMREHADEIIQLRRTNAGPILMIHPGGVSVAVSWVDVLRSFGPEALEKQIQGNLEKYSAGQTPKQRYMRREAQKLRHVIMKNPSQWRDRWRARIDPNLAQERVRVSVQVARLSKAYDTQFQTGLSLSPV